MTDTFHHEPAPISGGYLFADDCPDCEGCGRSMPSALKDLLPAPLHPWWPARYQTCYGTGVQWWQVSAEQIDAGRLQ